MEIREIGVEKVTETVRNLCIEANTNLGDDVIQAFKGCLENEESSMGRDAIRYLLDNAEMAREESQAVCQDTGLVVVFAEMGQDLHFAGGDLNEAIHEGVRQGYKDGFFRKSSLDPLVRKNIGDNTPAIIHLEIVPGDKLKLAVVPKGFGSENMGQVLLFHATIGVEEIKKYIIQRVEETAVNACPPVVVGVGIGGTMEKAALIAKKSLLRPIGQRHPRPDVAELEEDLLMEINKLGIGPLGFGGRFTAMDVHVEVYPTHITSVPVAFNIQCHSYRHKEAIL